MTFSTYDYLFKGIADPRVYNWPLMKDPLQVTALLAVYLFLIKILLPWYMKNRKPYSLKRIVAVYNILQIIGCCLIVYGVVTSGWTTHYTFGCQPIDYSQSKMAIRMASYMWWILMIKISDLIETNFYVLRKKYNQVSWLHVFHHTSVVLLAWFLTKYFPGGMASFPLTFNSCIHVIMYTYYLLASFGPEMQKKLAIVKSKLTLLQIVQICIIMIHGAQSLLPTCKVSGVLGIVLLIHMSIILGFFLNFYHKSYIQPKKKET